MARILVVDDNQQVLDLLNTVLTRKNHQVITAHEGRTALNLFRQDRPAITILDLNLGDTTGLDVLKHIRSVHPHHPVIILTGAGTEAEEREARELGVIEFLQKGFSLHVLGEALTRALHQPEHAEHDGPALP